MRAVRIHKHGGPEVLQIDNLPVPQPAAGEALVRIRTAALNHLDLWLRNGLRGLSLPLIMGSDAAGVIEAIGGGAKETGFKTGDAVILVPYRSCRACRECLSGNENLCPDYQIAGEQIQGYQADYVVVPCHNLLHRPENTSWEAAAAFPLAYMTAWHMLHRKAVIQPGQNVLIWGASSGVGSAAIQIAKAAGAKVISTAGTDEKSEFGLKLGADHVLNYRSEDVGRRTLELTGGKGVDIVFEHVGLASWTHSLKALSSGGKIITCGATTGPAVRIDLRHLFIKRQQILGSTMGDRHDLVSLIALITSKKIKPVYSHVFPLEEVGKAHQVLENGENLGKVVLNLSA